MPNVSRKRLLQSIRKEKNTVAGDRLRACLHRKEGWSIRRICKIMVRPYSTMRDWLWRMQEGGIRCRHDKERGRRECKIPKKVFRAVRRWVKKEPSDFKFESGSWQLNLLLEMIRERFGLECNARTLRRWLRRNRLSWRKSRHVPYKTASKSVQMEFKQKAGEQACQMRAEGYAVFTEDEAAIQTQQNQVRLEAHGRAGDEQDHVFNKIDPDVWRNVRRPTPHQGSRLCKLGDVPRIPGMDPPGSSKILHGTGQRILPQVKNDSGVRGICRRRHRP